MIGPKKRIQYCCEDCEHRIEITNRLDHCSLSSMSTKSIFGRETPKDCPYLIKAIRKDKLDKLEIIVI